MGFPQSFPLWMWLYFGTFGSAGAVLFTLIVLSWMKIRSYTKGYKRSAATWVCSATCSCLSRHGSPVESVVLRAGCFSTNQDMHYRFGAVLAAVLAMFFSIPGFVSQRKKLKINSVRDRRLRYERYNPSQHKAGARSNSFLYTLKSE